MPKITQRMKDSATELEMYAVNTGQIYPALLKIVAGLKRIVYEGRENDKPTPGVKWIVTWIRDAIPRYHREVGQEGPDYFFGVGAIRLAAERLRAEMIESIKNGEYDGEYGTPMVAVSGKPHERAGHLFRHDSDRTTRYMILQVGDPETGKFPWAVWDTHTAKVVERFNLRSSADKWCDELNGDQVTLVSTETGVAAIPRDALIV